MLRAVAVPQNRGLGVQVIKFRPQGNLPLTELISHPGTIGVLVELRHAARNVLLEVGAQKQIKSSPNSPNQFNLIAESSANATCDKSGYVTIHSASLSFQLIEYSGIDLHRLQLVLIPLDKINPKAGHHEPKNYMPAEEQPKLVVQLDMQAMRMGLTLPTQSPPRAYLLSLEWVAGKEPTEEELTFLLTNPFYKSLAFQDSKSALPQP